MTRKHRDRPVQPVRPRRAAPTQPWVMPVIVTVAAVIVLTAVIYATVNGVLFSVTGQP